MTSHPATAAPQHRRRDRPRTLLAITAAAVASATGFALLAGAGPTQAAPVGPDLLQKQFGAAAEEFHVPQKVLLALSYQQTRWESHHGQPSTTGNYNVMGLTEVDPAAVARAIASGPGPEVDGRGDDAPVTTEPAPVQVKDGPALHILDKAAKLLDQPADRLRADPAQSIRGGAALLAKYQKDSGRALSADPADWYQAVARFSESPESGGASGHAFADRVFDTMRTGAQRTTSDGQFVTLPADPGVRAGRPAAVDDSPPPECPAGLDCDVRPAAYALTNASDPTSYGNYSVADRPSDGDAIQYIVIHDTEGGFEGSISAFQNPRTQASAHYIVRSSDGHVSQLVPTKDIAWHAGNKTVNMHSIGIEHEGYAFPTTRPTWYSEQLYQSSAALVRYLAGQYGIPLDRQHILGHDDVPGPKQSDIAGMHWDPGTFWDWNHYLDLLGAPGRAATGGPILVGGKVTIAPAFDSGNTPPVDDMAARPENFVYLYTAPDGRTLINGGTTQAADVTDKAVAGTGYVVADQQGDWTAIWFGGQKAWFHNPDQRSAAADNRAGQTVLRPKAGRSSIPVYGRSYPELTAYRPYPGINTGRLSPVPYDTLTVPAGQAYLSVSGADPVAGDFYYAQDIDGDAPNDRTLVVGRDTYFPIRYDHRLAYLKSTDVELTANATPPPPGQTPAESSTGVTSKSCSASSAAIRRWASPGTESGVAPGQWQST